MIDEPDNMKSFKQQSDTDSVDLIDLIVQLWHGKLIIIAVVILALLFSGCYLLIAKEKWTSSAIITLPDSGQVAGYNYAMNVLYGNQNKIGDTQQNFFDRFAAGLYALSVELENQPKKEQLSIEPAIKGRALPVKVSYVSDSAEKAQNTLNKYINSINGKIISDLDRDISTNVKSRMEELKTTLNTLESVAQEKKDERFKALNQALIVAEQSNIRQPLLQNSLGVSDDALFVLGSDALSSMIKNERSSPLPLSGDYFSNRQRLIEASRLQKESQEKFAFRYVMKPDKPVFRDSPKRSVTLLLSAILGGIIGAGIVLGRNTLRNYKKIAA